MTAGRAAGLTERGRTVALLVALCAAAGIVALAVWGDTALRPGAVLALAAGIAAADLLGVDLHYRRGGGARVTLVEGVIAAALLWAGPLEIVAAVSAGMVVVQSVERLRAAKAMFNILQYMAAAGVAALVVVAAGVGGAGSAPTPFAAAVAVAATLSFTLFNSAAVSAMIAAHAGTALRAVFLRTAPSALLAAVGSASVGILAVVMIAQSPWAVVAVAAPIAALRIASRQQITAQLQRERSGTAIAIEQRLSETEDVTQVAQALAEGTSELLVCDAAVWVRGRWVGDAPSATGACACSAPPVAATVPAQDIGWVGDEPCVVVDVGVGVLAARRADDGAVALAVDDREWLTRLGESGRVHAARVAAAAAARREQETLAAVVGGTVDGIVVTDAAGTVRVCNPAMRTMAEATGPDAPDDWVGAPVSALLGEGPWQESGVHEVGRPAGGVWRVSVADVDAPDGFEARAATAQSRLFVAVAHDVTAAHKAARARDDMLAIVSHELKTPLTPIKVGATLLHRRWKGMEEPVREQMLAEISGRADHLHRLIDDLLLVAQLPGSPRTLVQITPMDFRETVERTVTAVGGLWPHHTVRVEGVEAAPGRSDPNRLRQVVAHLVDNACKFSPAETPIDVRVDTEETADGPVARVTVSDRGCGIPAGEHERVFERFARVEDPLVMTTSGTGLGLFIVRELVAAMSGEVTLDSALGHGTTVTVRLPLLARQLLPGADDRPPTGRVAAAPARTG